MFGASALRKSHVHRHSRTAVLMMAPPCVPHGARRCLAIACSIVSDPPPRALPEAAPVPSPRCWNTRASPSVSRRSHRVSNPAVLTWPQCCTRGPRTRPPQTGASRALCPASAAGRKPASPATTLTSGASSSGSTRMRRPKRSLWRKPSPSGFWKGSAAAASSV